MIDSIHYEIAEAGFLTMLFLVDLVKRHLPSMRTVFCRIMLCLMVLASYAKVFSRAFGAFAAAEPFREVLAAVTLYLQVLCFFAFYEYILALIYRLRKNRIQRRLDIAAFLLISLFLLSSPWTGFFFSIDQNGNLQRHPLFWVSAAIILILFGYLASVLWKSRSEYTLRRIMLCIMLDFGFLMSTVFEMVKPEGSAVYSMYLVFFIYAFYLSLQSPDFYVDSATGAFNRNGFLETFRERIAYQQETYCFLARIRNYNSMNRIYSEDALRSVQIQIRDILEQIADRGVVYHIGASTFAVVLRTETAVQEIYQKAKEQIPGEWEFPGETVSHEYSFYQVGYPVDSDDAEELIQRIHYARSDHENHHKPGELIRLRHDTVAEAEQKKKAAHLIEEAIMDNSLELHFQPIYSIEKNRITSLEVLSRLKDENKQYINPEFFIHVAEENHTIIPLGEQIFRKACIFASQNHIFELGIEDININLSPAQCRYENLTETLEKIAKEYAIPMERIHLEITESEFKDKEAVGRTLKRLKETGAKVALDDFGTGSSMLSNILELPVDYVKIDKSLVWSFAEGKNQFLNDLMALICAEGKRIIAEGIETAEHIDIIKRLHGDFLQGYYFSKPLPENQFIQYLRNFQGV